MTTMRESGTTSSTASAAFLKAAGLSPPAQQQRRRLEVPEPLRIEAIGFDRPQFPRDRVRRIHPRLPHGQRPHVLHRLGRQPGDLAHRGFDHPVPVSLPQQRVQPFDDLVGVDLLTGHLDPRIVEHQFAERSR